MAKSETVTLVTAPSGTGKSYSELEHLADVVLPQTELIFITNLPAFIEETETHKGLVNYCKGFLSADEVRRRVMLIPDDEIQEWRNVAAEASGGRKVDADTLAGPWSYFESDEFLDEIESRRPEGFDGARRSLDGCLIAIDEIHNFAGDDLPRAVKAKWSRWLGELRHRGAAIRFISQAEGKICRQVQREAAIKIRLASSANRRIPFLKIPLGDFYELRAGLLTGSYRDTIWRTEYRYANTRWVEEHAETFRFRPEIFQCYDSHAAPIAGGAAGSQQKHAFERYSKLGLLGWFMVRNWFPVTWSTAVACLAVWLILFGGAGWVFGAFLEVVKNAVAKPKPPTTAKVEALPAASKLIPKPPTSPTVATLPQPPKPGETIKPPQAEQSVLFQQKRNTVKVVLLQHDSIILQGGGFYEVGDKIADGPLQGVTVESIDYERRTVDVTGGSLRLGVLTDVSEWMPGGGPSVQGSNSRLATSATSDSAAEVPRPVLGRARPQFVGPGERQRRRAAGDDLGQ